MVKINGVVLSDKDVIEILRDNLQGFVDYFKDDSDLDNGLEELVSGANVLLEETEDY